MESYYRILLAPTKETLKKHLITCFDKVIGAYPKDNEKIILYINECYNYKSPFLVEEKDWWEFLNERFKINDLPPKFVRDIVYLENPDVASSIDDFLVLQKKNEFQTLVAKQSLRQQMLVEIQNPASAISDKKSANDMITQLDEEISSIFEAMRAEQKAFGNYKGFDAVKKAKAITQINIANI